MSRRKSPTSRPVPHALVSVVRQNVAGDVVVPAEVGEIVLLPRLWGFALDIDAHGVLELTRDSGLSAVAELGDRGDVVVRHVAEARDDVRVRARVAS